MSEESPFEAGGAAWTRDGPRIEIASLDEARRFCEDEDKARAARAVRERNELMGAMSRLLGPESERAR